MTSVFIRLCLNYPLANSVAAKIVKFLIVVFSKSVCLLNVSVAVIIGAGSKQRNRNRQIIVICSTYKSNCYEELFLKQRS